MQQIFIDFWDGKALQPSQAQHPILGIGPDADRISLIASQQEQVVPLHPYEKPNMPQWAIVSSTP